MRRLILEGRGDLSETVLLTVIPRELHRNYPGRFRVHVRTTNPDVWLHNPYVDGQLPLSGGAELSHVQTVRPQAAVWPHRPRHLMQALLESAADQLSLNRLALTELRPCIHVGGREPLTQPSRHGVLEGKPYWVIVPGWHERRSISAWDHRKWQQVVSRLATSTDFLLAHCGNAKMFPNNPPLKLAVDLRHTTVRECIWLIHHARGVITGPNGFMHVAAALGKPCVVVAGRAVPAWCVGYTREMFERYAPEIDDKYESLGRLLMAQDFLEGNPARPCYLDGCFRPRLVDEESGRACRQLVQSDRASPTKPSIPQAGCVYSIQPEAVVERVLARDAAVRERMEVIHG